MDDRVADYLLRLAAGVLTAAGVVTVLIGYVQLRDEHEVALQLPFLMSAGIGGLILVGLGAMALIQVQMRIQARRFAQMTDQLDEWKDAALAEIRTFLEGSEVEVEIQGPPVAPAVMASFRNASAR